MKARTAIIGIGIALAVIVLLGGGWLLGSQVWSGGCCQSGFGMFDSYSSRGGMHTVGGGILMLIFWGAIIGGIALLAAGLARRGPRSTGEGESSLDIARRRYASGEIDREEFERMKELLSR